MGLGWSPDQRENVAGRAICRRQPPKPTKGKVVAARKKARVGDDTNLRRISTVDSFAVLGDGPALWRMFTHYPSSPEKIAKMVVGRLVAFGVPKAICVLFDDASNMPWTRALVAQSRQGAPLTEDEKQKIVDLHLSPMVPGHLSCTMPWDILFRDSTAKAAVWEIAAKAIFDHLCTFPGLTIEVISAGAARVRAGKVGVPKRGSPCGYGEADIQVAVRLSEFARAGFECIVSTVDYDFFLQTLLAPDEHSCKFIQFKNDVIDGTVLRDMFCRKGRASSLSAAFFLLACFKSDYSKSVSGPSKTRINKLVECMRAAGNGAEDMMVLDEGVDEKGHTTLVFYPPLVKPILGLTSDVVTELVCKILWTVAYFGLYARGSATCVAPPPCQPPSNFWLLEEFRVPVFVSA